MKSVGWWIYLSVSPFLVVVPDNGYEEENQNGTGGESGGSVVDPGDLYDAVGDGEESDADQEALEDAGCAQGVSWRGGPQGPRSSRGLLGAGTAHPLSPSVEQHLSTDKSEFYIRPRARVRTPIQLPKPGDRRNYKTVENVALTTKGLQEIKCNLWVGRWKNR